VSWRNQRVADQIRSELTSIIQREVKDPRVGLATVSEVRLSGDLSHALIRVSVLGDDEPARAGTIDALRHALGFIRRRLAGRIRLRRVPELVLELDRGAEHSQHISDLLESLEHERQRRS